MHIQVVVARERAPTSLCDRSHGVETQWGRIAAMLRCWAAKPVRPLNAPSSRDEKVSQQRIVLTISKKMLDWAAGSPMNGRSSVRSDNRRCCSRKVGTEDTSRRSLLGVGSFRRTVVCRGAG